MTPEQWDFLITLIDARLRLLRSALLKPALAMPNPANRRKKWLLEAEQSCAIAVRATLLAARETGLLLVEAEADDPNLEAGGA